jgi:RNA polymerase sigma-70 factor (ECF subfamily)
MGDRAAFAELVRRTSRGLFARLYAQVQDAADAEDLLQETYLVAWKRLAQVTDSAGVRAWLLTIARTVLIDAARRKHRLKRGGVLAFLGQNGLEQAPASAATPAADAMKEELRGQVIDALATLPAGCREPLLMRFIAGADYQTILRELKLTDGQLRGLLHRGMGLLRARLAERGITSDEC